MQGSRPLIDDAEGKTHMEIAVQEIIEDKIAADFKNSGFDKAIEE